MGSSFLLSRVDSPGHPTGGVSVRRVKKQATDQFSAPKIGQIDKRNDHPDRPHLQS